MGQRRGLDLPRTNPKEIKLMVFDGLKTGAKVNQGVVMVSSFLPCTIQ